MPVDAGATKGARTPGSERRTPSAEHSRKRQQKRRNTGAKKCNRDSEADLEIAKVKCASRNTGVNEVNCIKCEIER